MAQDMAMEVVIGVWHAYRTPIFLAAAIAICVLRFWTARRSRSRRNSSSSSSSSVTQRLPSALDDEKSQPVAIDAARASPKPKPTSRVAKAPPKRIIGTRPDKNTPTPSSTTHTIQPIVFYSSLSGSTENAASKLIDLYSAIPNASSGSQPLLDPLLLDLSSLDYDDYFTNLPTNPQNQTAQFQYFYIILIPTYNIDTILTNFLIHLDETHHDFRVDTAPLSNLLGYAVFGFGDRHGWPTEDAGFCSQAIQVDKWMAKLTAHKRAYPLGMGDLNTDGLASLLTWASGVRAVLQDLANGRGLGEGVPGSGEAVESDDEEGEEEGQGVTQRKSKPPTTKASAIDDLESLGASIKQPSLDNPPASNLPVDFTTTNPGNKSATSPSPAPATPLKEMVPKSSPTYNALTKQGYTIVGSHSGVKICRWTKSALRGRGSCYKFSFYGIKSHLCMETTPSLSCSNKCVFCWRHGTNPVSTTWRWQVDPPDLIFDGVKKGHYSKIKMMRGVPGVRAERFEEAMQIRHCALSLVGEPIFYPHINEFTALLHNERISSFLVCNAQHPDQLETLHRVTQLYVSIDASNRESLRKIDRPLHRDFWERFCRCLDILREKRFQQRTVFRLTLVKGFNVDDEVEGYANLVERGLPCFVEIKGVTYCGTTSSAGAGLTMRNVPFYEEVCEFVHALDAALERRGLQYGIAAEHAHSCCVLIASKRFLSPAGRWQTVIDYGKFFELLESGSDFTPEQYTADTPEWALWGNGGFDPADERVKRKTKKEAATSAAPNNT